MTPIDAWQQAGAVGLLIVTWSGIVWWLLRDRQEIRRELREATKSQLDLLAKLEERDREELRTLRDAERRRREMAGD